MLEVKKVLTKLLIKGRAAAQTTRATNLTLQGVVLRAAFDTPRVVRTGAVELTEWDLLAALVP